jgi:hypothetical protein
MSVVGEFWIVLNAFLLFIPYGLWKLKSGLRFSRFELYVLIMIGLIPMMSAYRAFVEFGQPVLYGVLNQRHMVLCVAGLAVIYAGSVRLISLRDIEYGFLWCSWITLISYVIINLVFDPTNYIDSGKSFVSGGGVDQAAFVFDGVFIVFAFFYYSIKALRERTYKGHCVALIFLGYMVLAGGGRSQLLSLIITYGLFLISLSSFSRFIILLPKIVISISILMTLFFVYDQSYMLDLIDQFSNAFIAVLTGQITGDAGTDARVSESIIAFPYIVKNLVFGNGAISSQWQGGYEGVVGGYFFPSDIGLLGVVFVFGLFGSMLFFLQVIFAMSFYKSIPLNFRFRALTDSVAATSLCIFMQSAATGRAAFYCEITILLVAVLYLCKKASLKSDFNIIH